MGEAFIRHSFAHLQDLILYCSALSTPLSLLHLKLALRVALASCWAGLLVVAGVVLLSAHMPGLLVRLAPVAGWTAIAAGQIVFSGLVADRLCPHADARVTGSVQLLCGLIMAGGLVALVVVWLDAGA